MVNKDKVNKDKVNKDKVSGEMILPGNSQKFVRKMAMKDINLYLAQYHICTKNTNVKTKEKKPFIPVMFRMIEGDVERKNGSGNEELMELANALIGRNRRLSKQFPGHEEYEFEPCDKMIIGESGAAYFNVQPLRLHPLYGLPLIPASVMKGIFRGAWMAEYGDDSGGNTGTDFVKLFGSGDRESAHSQGKLVFFDSYPKRFSIGLDVQTPHYKKYYKPRPIEPTDDQFPFPISFVCLRETVFHIQVACQDSELWIRNKEKIDKLMWMVFTQYGIGAKGALGYGLM